MNKKEYLATCVMEEAAELSQAVSKSVRFGIDSYNPETPQFTNYDDIIREYIHVTTVLQQYLKVCGKELPPTEEVTKQIKAAKLFRLDKAFNISINEGCLEPDLKKEGL